MYKKLLLVLGLTFFSPSAHAVELSLEEALEYALERNEDIDIAELTIEQSKYIVREVEAAIYPTITATGQYIAGHSFESPYKAPSTSGHRFNAGMGIEVNQLLFAFGMIENAIEAAELAEQLMFTQKDIAYTSLRYAIRNAYFAALMYEENYRIARQSYRNALNTKKKLEASASVRTSQSDLIKVDADIASRKPTVDSAKLLLEQSYRLLQALCVLEEPVTKLTTQFDDMEIMKFDLNTALPLLSNSPEIKILEQQIGYHTKLAEAKRDTDNPTVALTASYNFGDSSEYLHLTEPTWTGEGSIGVVFSIPLYDGGKAEAQGRQEDYNAKISAKKLQQTTRNLEQTLINAYETYTTNLEVLKKDDEAIVLANRSYEVSLARFLNGQASAVELNDVESGLTQLKMKRIATINSIYSSLAEIERIVGDI